MNFTLQFKTSSDLKGLPWDTSEGYCPPSPATRYWVRGWVRGLRWLVCSPAMGYRPGDRELVAHLYGAHGWDLPYLNHAKRRVQHEWEHRWGVPPPESGGPWSIYLQPLFEEGPWDRA